MHSVGIARQLDGVEETDDGWGADQIERMSSHRRLKYLHTRFLKVLPVVP